MSRRLTPAVFIAVLLAGSPAAGFEPLSLPWPHHPVDQSHPIGNGWGNYQNYGGAPYLHNGIDIMTGSLVPCVAIKGGYVKGVWITGNPMYNGVTVADSAGSAFCHGLMYYHLDHRTIRVSAGDTVRVGDTLGLISDWSVAQFHHNHFSWNRNSGVTWPNYGAFFRNPQLDLVPSYDSVMPVFLDAYTGQRFAICRDNSSSYQDRDSIYGSVDFICRLDDRINHRLWKVNVYKITYTIRDSAGNTVVPLTRSFEFTDSIGSGAVQSRVVYKQDAVCRTQCNYDSLNRRYFFVFTNTNGDSLIQASDSLHHWNTTQVADGPYWVVVTASDYYGNTVVDSMLVRVKNNPPDFRDVGVTVIALPALVEPGETVVPACTVYNYGSTTESYGVRLRIGAGYDSTLAVTDHRPGVRLGLEFPAWTAPEEPGPHAASCSTRLDGDRNPANDARSCTSRVALHNVGTLAILAPRDTVDTANVITPRAVVRNYGDQGETFEVCFRIGRDYADRKPLTLAAGASDTVEFAPWVAAGPGWYGTSCSTELAGDYDPADDRVSDSVYVLPGSGVAAGPAPVALAFHGAQPNPLSGPGWVRYDLAAAGPVRLELCDAAGRRVAVLAAGLQPAGRHRVRLDGGRLAAGVYWLRLQAAGRTLADKVVVSN